jgi:hypothetical protein
MPTFNPAKDIPSDFYTAKTFFTLSGAAASVWIFCLVIGAIFPTDSITPLQYRIMAISLSEIIALLMVVRIKNKKIESWFLAIFNGLLIFVNASGWNVITTNNFFSDKNKSAKISYYRNDERKKEILAGIQLFKKQIYWWQDNSTFVENRQLKNENKVLTEKIVVLKNEIVEHNPTDSTSNQCDAQIKKLKDSLLEELQKRDNSIRDLNALVNSLKIQNNKTASPKLLNTDTLSMDERKKLLYSMRILQQQYETKLKICDDEKNELQSKLNIIKRGLDKYGSGNR